MTLLFMLQNLEQTDGQTSSVGWIVIAVVWSVLGLLRLAGVFHLFEWEALGTHNAAD